MREQSRGALPLLLCLCFLINLDAFRTSRNSALSSFLTQSKNYNGIFDLSRGGAASSKKKSVKQKVEEEEEEDLDKDETDNEYEDEEEQKEAIDASLLKSTVSSTNKQGKKQQKKSKTAINTVLQTEKTKRQFKKKSFFPKLRLPYIFRAFLNPLTVFSMTKGYFASLFNVSYLEEIQQEKQSLRPTFEDQRKSHDTKKKKRSMKPGQAKTLSDLPKLG